MSRVSIEIDGVKWGLNISPDSAMKLIGALNAVWVTSARHKRGECDLGDVANARDLAKSAIVDMAVEIFRSARKAA